MGTVTCTGDTTADAIISNRWQVVSTFFEVHLGASPTWSNLDAHAERQRLQHQFTALEHTVTRARASSAVDRSNGRATWHHDYLLPIARALGWVEAAYHAQIRWCWNHGRFDRERSSGVPRHRPAFPTVLSRIHETVNPAALMRQQAAALVKAKLCRDAAIAGDVIARLNQSEQQAASQVRGLLLAAIAYGPLGLLHHSEYAYTDELWALQRHTEQIAQLTDDLPRMMRLLYDDVIALCKTRDGLSAPCVWANQLLVESPNGAYRVRYQQRIQGMDEMICVHLAHHRCCSLQDAAALFHHLITGGLASIIDWRCILQPGDAHHSLRQVQITRLVEQHFALLTDAGRATLLEWLMHLDAAAREVAFPLPVRALLNQPPSSLFRVRLGRRLAWGYPAILRRQKRTTRQKHKRRLQRSPSEERPATEVAPEIRLAEALSVRLGWTPREARARLRQFVTYGGIGLFPKADWHALVDARLVSYLYMLKLGKPDGTLAWDSVQDRVHTYAATLGRPAPGKHLLRTLFNTLPKPS